MGIVLVIILAASIVMRGASTIRKGGGDLRGYVEVGELVLDGQDPYATEKVETNTWPPLFSVLVVPLALAVRAAPRLTATVWLALMAICLYGCVYFAIRLVYRRPLTLASRPGAIPLTSAAVLVPAILTWRYVLQNVRWLQINFLILLLTLAGCYWLSRQRPARGGALVGAGAAIKVMPVFFVPYFALKRWWRATIAMLVAGAILSLSPVLVFGPAGFAAHVRTWLERTRSIPMPVDWGNHSLFAMVDRYVGHRVLTNRELLGSDVPLTASGDAAVPIIVAGLAALLVLVFVVVARRGGRDPASPEATVEFAMVLVLIPVLSPTLSWTHYFVYLLLAHTVLWRAVSSSVAETAGDPGLRGGERRVLRRLLALSVALGLLGSSSIVGSAVARRTQMLSVVTVSALVVFAALAYLRWLMRRRAVWPDEPAHDRAAEGADA